MKPDLTGGDKDETLPLRVLQVTDTHLFAHTGEQLAGVTTAQSHRKVMERVFAEFWPVDVVLATGDIVHDGSEQAYRRFKDDLESLGVPTLVIPGNHDEPSVMRRVFDAGRVRWSGHAVFGRWQFIMLDSHKADSSAGHLPDCELVRLERRLAAAPQHHTVVCLHHHPVAVSSAWIDRIGVDNGDALFEILDRYASVRAVVWGHVHQHFEARRRGVRLLASPSTCVQFRPRARDFSIDDRAPGFRWLKLHGDGRIETDVVRIDGVACPVDMACEGYR